MSKYITIKFKDKSEATSNHWTLIKYYDFDEYYVRASTSVTFTVNKEEFERIKKMLHRTLGGYK